MIWGSDYGDLLNGAAASTQSRAAVAPTSSTAAPGRYDAGRPGQDIFIVDDAGDDVTEASAKASTGADQRELQPRGRSEVEVLYADPATTTTTMI